MIKKKAKIGFNLYRYSMGWDWMSFRPEYEWFTLESILSGHDDKWNQLTTKNPSLLKVLNHIQIEYQDYINKFVERYNVNPQKVKEFYNMHVGYHPAYGAYMVGVGPYVGEKPEDEENKYGYFTMRYPSTDSRNLLTLWNKNLMGHETYKAIRDDLGVDRLGDIVAPEDFALQVRQKTSPDKGKAGENYELIKMTPEFLAENDYQKAVDEGREPPFRSVMGIGSYFQIQASGVFKLLVRESEKHGQEAELKNIISQVAARRGIPEEEIISYAKNDLEFAKEVSGVYAEINPIVEGITTPRRSGSQRTEALKPSREQTQMIKLMKEICEIIVNLNSKDPSQIAQALNSTRPKKKGKAQGMFTSEIVSHWLEQIKFFQESHDEEGNIEKVKSYGEMVQEFDNNMVDMRQGFDDMETALKIASLRFAEVQSTEIDPVSRAKLVMIPSMFKMPTNVNLTSQDLTEMRLGEGFTPQLQEENPVEKVGEMPIEDADAEQIQIDKPSMKIPKPVEEGVEENELVEEDKKELTSSLKALRRVAIDLRTHGNFKTALRLESVIKKYQGKILK